MGINHTSVFLHGLGLPSLFPGKPSVLQKGHNSCKLIHYKDLAKRTILNELAHHRILVMVKLPSEIQPSKHETSPQRWHTVGSTSSEQGGKSPRHTQNPLSGN